MKPYFEKLMVDDKTLYGTTYSIGTDKQIYDSFITIDRVDTTSTLKFNGTEYITPEASGGAWSSATEVMAGSFVTGVIGIDKDSSNNVWIVAEDTGDEIQLIIRNAANSSDVLANTNITDAGGDPIYDGPLIAIDDQDKGWIIYRNGTTSNQLTLTVMNSSAAIQHSLDETNVDAGNVFRGTTPRKYDLAYDGDTHMWIIGADSGHTKVSIKIYNTSDGSVFKDSFRLTTSGSAITDVFMVANTTNKFVYPAILTTTGVIIYKLNSIGQIVNSKSFGDISTSAIMGYAISNDGARLCVILRTATGTFQQALIIDTATMQGVGNPDSFTDGGTQEVSKGQLCAGPDDRFHYISRDGTGDLIEKVINKDGTIFATTDNVDTNANVPACIWNDDNTSNFIWLAYNNAGDSDIDTRTYDFVFDTNTAGFFVQSKTITRTNVASYGVEYVDVETNVGDTVQIDLSADNASNFNTSLTIGTPIAFSNQDTNIVTKITAVASNDYIAPKIKGWLARVNE